MNGPTMKFEVIGKLLDATGQQVKVVGQNVSNINTPGYKRQELHFETELARVLNGDESTMAQNVVYSVRQGEGTETRVDGNNVDVDMEMGLLSNAIMLHEAFVEILATNLRMMRSAITGQQ